MVEQRDAQQVEQRTQQADQQIAHGRGQGIRTTGQRHQRDRRQTQQFQRDIEIENIGGEKQRIQRGPQEQPKWPKDSGWFAFEITAGIDTDTEPQARCYHEHQQTQTISVQINT